MFYNDEILFLAVELKYCERCGSLHVRRSSSKAKFCLPCIDAEQAVVEQVFGTRRKQSRIQNWLGSVSAVLVAARQSAIAPEMKGGAQ
jgi:hypothetical protein